MTTISAKKFRELAAIEGAFCVSFYLPAHRSGMEVINREDTLLFKNQLKLASEELIRHGMADMEIDEFLQPAWNLYADPGFWRYQKEGLAVFVARDFLQYIHLPYSPSPYIFVAHEFYLKPLIPALHGDGRFYLLGLNLHHVSFYEGDRQKLKEIYVKDTVPQRLEEVVGMDYKERFQSFHSQGVGYGQGTVFHGQGEWKGEFRKEEILRFFHAVDKSILQRIEDLKAPLLFAGVDYLFPIYQEANTYQHLLDEHIGRNPEGMSLEELHQESWPRVYSYFDRERLGKLELYGNYQETTRTSYDIKEIIPMAIAGRVDVLFLDEATQLWGVYDPVSGRVHIHDEQRTINTDLLNLAAKEVLLNKGQVYLMPKEALPQPFSAVNALYRY